MGAGATQALDWGAQTAGSRALTVPLAWFCGTGRGAAHLAVQRAGVLFTAMCGGPPCTCDRKNKRCAVSFVRRMARLGPRCGAMEIAHRDRASAHAGGNCTPGSSVQWHRAGVNRRSAQRRTGSSACRDTACARPARGNMRACGAGLAANTGASRALTVPFSRFCATGRDAAHLVV